MWALSFWDEAHIFMIIPSYFGWLIIAIFAPRTIIHGQNVCLCYIYITELSHVIIHSSSVKIWYSLWNLGFSLFIAFILIATSKVLIRDVIPNRPEILSLRSIILTYSSISSIEHCPCKHEIRISLNSLASTSTSESSIISTTSNP